MDAKHTSGPWDTSPDAVPEGHIQITVYAEDGSNGGRGTRVATVFEAEANARLIAAAPDLLAACQYARQFSDVDINPTIRKRLDAAIAKAKGMTP